MCITKFKRDWRVPVPAPISHILISLLNSTRNVHAENEIICIIEIVKLNFGGTRSFFYYY